MLYLAAACLFLAGCLLLWMGVSFVQVAVYLTRKYRGREVTWADLLYWGRDPAQQTNTGENSTGSDTRCAE